MNGFRLPNGEILSVIEYEHKEKNIALDASQNGKKFTNLYVKNFPHPNFSEDEMKKMFGKYGEISNLVIMRDEN
jgi:RNA recognition motif-containing protein